MSTVTLSAKGQLVLPKGVRDRLKLVRGSKVVVTVDERNRVVLTPALGTPAELFEGRPRVTKVVTIEDMDRAIGRAVRGRV